MFAASENHCGCIALLLDAGADRSIAMEAANYFKATPGTTALGLAITKGHRDAEALISA